MAIRVIDYCVSAKGIEPASQQFGGIQGEHNVTQLRFSLESDLLAKIKAQAGDNEVRYRFDAYDNMGGVFSTEPLTLGDDACVYLLSERLTRYGGNIQVYLIITELDGSRTESEMYSFPAVIRLKNRPKGEPLEGEDRDSITSLAESARRYAEASEKSAAASLESYKELLEAMPKVTVTETESGARVTVKDKNGTTTADIENGAKGDKGDKGDKGEKGDRGEKGDSGADGRGVTGSEINSSGELIISYTDGSAENLGSASDLVSVSNAVKATVIGSSLLIRDVSPLKHSLKIKCSVPTSGTENKTVINEIFSSDSEFSLPVSSDSFHLHAGGADSNNSSSSVFVPIVDGVPLTEASVPTNANFEVYITHDLDYSISGTTLTVSGSWSYEENGTHTTKVNKTVTVAAGSKLTGIALQGMSAGGTETCALTVSTVQAIPTAVTVTAPDGTVSTGSASADGTVTGLNSTASPMTVSVSAGTVSVTYNRDISSCLSERANALVSQKSGSMLRIDDISPCDDTVTVNVSAVGDNVPTKVYRYGRNILDPTPWVTPVTVSGVTYTYLPDEDCFLINGTATASGGPRKLDIRYALGSTFVISLKYISGSVTIPPSQGKFASFHMGKADTTTETASNFFSCGLQNKDNETSVKNCDKNYWQASWFYVSEGVVFDSYKVKVQVECNDSATAYEKYAAPAELAPDTNGNVTAARENVCTFAVKSPGTLSTRYNRDINKAFDELKQAIISLGGNV